MPIKLSYSHYFKEKLYHFLKRKGYSDKNLLLLFSNDCIKVNSKIIKDKNYILPFKKVKIVVSLCEEYSFLPLYKDNLNILFEDDYLMVVDKPFNMDIEPTKANYKDNLACRILNYYNDNNIFSKIHFVNRLDKMTSGLVIVAKNQYIHHLFSKVKIKKYYFAKVEGKTSKKGKIQIRIKKSLDSIKRIVSPEGKKCITKYKRLHYDGKQSLVKINLLTGRTHQIRVSFAYIHHPLVADPLYNIAFTNDPFFLRAYQISFIHPITKKYIHLKSKKK